MVPRGLRLQPRSQTSSVLPQMKRERELDILLVAVSCGIAALIVWMTAGSRTWNSAAGTGGLGFGGCTVQYDWRSRNDEPIEILNLIVCSEAPSKLEVRGKSREIHAKFADGSSCDVVPDASSLAWLEPGKQPRRIEVGDLRPIVSQIEQYSSASEGAKFTSPEEFLAGIRKLAEQAPQVDGKQPSY